jgi:hypothetical protein
LKGSIMNDNHFSMRRRQVLMMGAGVLATPAVAMAASEPVVQFNGGKVVVSGRVVGAQDGKALAGAQIEIWRVDARGVRAEASHEIVTADGDGRYFAVLNGNAQRLHYRVSHKGYVTKVAQLQAGSATQRAVTLTRDDAGITRAAFEMKLAPRSAVAVGSPDFIAL